MPRLQLTAASARPYRSRIRHALPITTLALVVLATPASGADRALASCPDLVPLRPVAAADRAARRCAKTLARAGLRFLAGALAARQACLARWQAEPGDEDAEATCLGRVVLETGARVPPTDEETSDRLAAFEAAARRRIDARCGVPSAVVPYGCDADEVAECVLLDHTEHVLHLLGAAYGDPAPLTGRGARRCQRSIARASRAAVLGMIRAIGRCIARHAGAADVTARCLGAVEHGVAVRPMDRATARRIVAAERRFRDRRTRCGADDLAALDACADDGVGLAVCLGCVHRREALLLAQATHAAEPERPATGFVDWAAIRNPVLALDDQALKDQSLAWSDGWFHLFSSVRWRPDDPEAATTPRWFFRTRDLLAWESYVGNDALNGPGVGPGSPDVTNLGSLWRMTFQGRPAASVDPNDREIFLAISSDLDAWSAPSQLTDGLVPDAPIIDGALAFAGGRWILGFKDRVRQTFQVARSAGAQLDGTFEAPMRAYAGPDDPRDGFAENYQFVEIDGAWRLVATARDPDPYRCPGTVFFIYTCDHEPFIYSIGGPADDPTSWTRWERKRRLRIPFEDWNRVMHANTGHLVDWRAHDGFFYLSYAGAADGDQFELRGHGKIGLARSRDLVHWRVPGDLRD